jgi:hypothetical protein
MGRVKISVEFVIYNYHNRCVVRLEGEAAYFNCSALCTLGMGVRLGSDSPRMIKNIQSDCFISFIKR